MELSYHPGVGAKLMGEVERQARRIGLPLSTLELIGQDAKVARDFLRAARKGQGPAFVDRLDRLALERLLAARETRRGGPSPLGFFQGA